jgi:hypothetical protein
VPKPGLAVFLRAAARAAMAAGSAGSVASMLLVGRHNPSRFLMALFAGWVLAPFIALGWANVVSNRRSVLADSVTLAIAVGSLAIYGAVAFGPPRAKPASIFLMAPLASWLVIAITAWLSQRGGGS